MATSSAISHSMATLQTITAPSLAFFPGRITLPESLSGAGIRGFGGVRLMSRSFRRVLTFAIGFVTAIAAGPALASVEAGNQQSDLSGINHIVVIYEENHSFDNLYGLWEGVNGLANADPARTTQVAQDGTPYACLKQNDVNLTTPPLPAGCSTTSNFHNEPFLINTYIQPTDTTCPQPGQEFAKPTGWTKETGITGGCTRDIVHRFYQEQYQLHS